MALDITGLGKVAGIGGIAVGAAVLVLRPLIEGALPDLDPEARSQAALVIAIGAFALGALGILAWIIGARTGRSGQTVRASRHGAAAGRDAVVRSTVSGSRESGGADAESERTEPRYQQVKADRHGVAAGRDAIVNSDFREKAKHAPRVGGKRRP